MSRLVVCVLLSLAATSVAKSLRTQTRSFQNVSKASAHVYVINKDSNKMRCTCMSAQLAESKIPYSVSRMPAATTKDYKSQCTEVPGLESIAHRFGTQSWDGAEVALYCSNFKVWKEAMASHSDKEFIIIFEDDAKITNMGLWEKVDELLKSDCAKRWDHILVDTYGATHGQKPGESHVCDGTNFKLDASGCCGAHMQIVRRSALPKMIEHAKKKGGGIVDMVDWWMAPEIRRYTWQPSVVTQFAVVNGGKSDKPGYCSDAVYEHQIVPNMALNPMQQFYEKPAPAAAVNLAFKC